MKKFSSLLLAAASVLTCVIGSSQAFALSPPWIILQNEMKAALGQPDPCVYVKDLKEIRSGLNLDIEVCKEERAEALASLIVPTRDFGGVIVHIRVFGPDSDYPLVPKPFPSDAEDAAKVIVRALHGNHLFVKVDPANQVNQLFIEFKPRVVQFYGDNLADFYNNINLTAEDAFADALGIARIYQIHIGVTTTPIDPGSGHLN